MESLFGFTGADYTLIVADSAAMRSVVKFKDTEDKILEVDQFKLMGVTGPNGDRVHFTEFVLRNLHLYELSNGITLSTHAAANWTRGQLATAMRRNPYEVHMLIGGYDGETKGPSLYFMDYMASLAKVDKAAHGYCSYFILSTMDKYWKKGMNLEEGLELVKKCIHAIHTRFMVNTPFFTIKIADKNGVRELELPGYGRPALL